MPEEKAVSSAVSAIHQALEQAEYALSKLSTPLQFLIGHHGEIEIVRRTQAGDTIRPKVVIAELRGCDPMLWRPDTAKRLKIGTEWMTASPPVVSDSGKMQAQSSLPGQRNGGNKPT